ncbi:MAG: hypothetical protein FRX49_01436 [Trebouxia sp. A1-2]|nr:MAG: hypothetical protein FRX49_01436 [Trebouxia sp. A1-2]
MSLRQTAKLDVLQAGHTPQTPKAPDPEELMSLVPDSRFKNQGVFGKFDSPVKAGQPANFPAPPEVEYSSRQFCKPLAEEIPFHKLVKTLSQKGFFAMDDGKMLFKKASHIDNQSTNSQECSHVLLHDEAKPTLLTQTPVEEAGPSSRHMYGTKAMTLEEEVLEKKKAYLNRECRLCRCASAAEQLYGLLSPDYEHATTLFLSWYEQQRAC